MKRVLVAGLQHESNSFNPIVTGERISRSSAEPKFSIVFVQTTRSVASSSR